MYLVKKHRLTPRKSLATFSNVILLFLHIYSHTAWYSMGEEEIRWIKAWICSERLIAILVYAIVNTWLYQGSRIWPHSDATRTQTNEGSSFVNITEKAAHQHAQNVTFWYFAAAWLFRLTGWFYIHLFYSSKVHTYHDTAWLKNSKAAYLVKCTVQVFMY